MDKIYIKNKDLKPMNTQLDVSFYQTNKEIIKLCPNGDIYVKGRLVENDIEVVNGMRELLGLK